MLAVASHDDTSLWERSEIQGDVIPYSGFHIRIWSSQDPSQAWKPHLHISQGIRSMHSALKPWISSPVAAETYQCCQGTAFLWLGQHLLVKVHLLHFHLSSCDTLMGGQVPLQNCRCLEAACSRNCWSKTTFSHSSSSLSPWKRWGVKFRRQAREQHA